MMDSTKLFKEEDILPEEIEHRVCTACLCATRVTHKLDGDMLKCYMNILIEAQLVSDMCVSPSVCWECLSLLKRWTRFREQAKQSFAILHSALQRCDQKDTNKFLVSEVSRRGRLECRFSSSIDICPGKSDNDSKVMTAALSDGDDYDHKQLLPVKKEVEWETEIHVDELIEDNTQTKILIEPLESVECEYFDNSKESSAMLCSDKQSKEKSIGNTSCMGSHAAKKQVKCDKLLSHKSRLGKHQKSVKRLHNEAERPYQCKQCPTTFTTDKQLSRHKNTHRKDKPHRCHLCRKTFTKVNSLHAHITTHTDPSVKLPFKCEVCLRPFKNESNCLQHERTHSGETRNRNQAKVECLVCSKTLCNKGSLKVHMLTHTGELNWTCEVCHRQFLVKSMLAEHIVRAHSNAKPFQCEICPKAYKIKYELNVHLLTHTGVKQFQCSECLKTFTTKKYLRIHLETHSDKKPFKCDVCLKSFKSKSAMVLHKVIHTGERPFQCEVCNKSFITKKHLIRHQIVHTRERPFQCNVCSNRYARKDYLLVHMRSHTGNTAHSSA